jgi:hypothetical protein
MYCEMLDLPVGSTYDDSVDVFAPAGIYKLDLHGYPVIEALELAEDIVHQCWLSGFDRITIIHGSPNIRNRMQSQCMGRGGIKWGLRSLLYQGDWSRYVYPRRSAKHFIDDGYMVLALRPA